MNAGAEAPLVERARDGDRDAFDTLVDARLEATFTALAAILDDGSDPADATRRVFARAWQNLPRLEAASRFDGWFGRLLVDACRVRGGGRSRAPARTATDFSDDTTRSTGGRRRGRGGPRVREIHVAPARDTQDVAAGIGVVDLRREGEGDPLTRSLARLSVAERASLYLHAHDHLSAAEAGRRLGTSAKGAWSRFLAARRSLAEALAADTGGDPDTWPADDAIRVALGRRAGVRPAPWDLRTTVAEALRGIGQVPRWRARLGRLVTVRRLRLVSVAGLATVAAVLLVTTALDRRSSPAPVEAVHRSGLLAYLLDGDVYLSDGRGLGSVRVLHADGVTFQTVAWSPTRNMLAASSSDAVFILDASSLAVRRLATGRFAAWSPDGLFIAVLDRSAEFIDGSQTVRIVWVADGRTEREITPPAGTGIREAAWSPDGRWLAATTFSHLLRLDVRTGLVAEIAQFQRIFFSESRPAWSPDSRRIAYVDWRSNFDGGNVGDVCNGDCTGTIVTVGVDGSDPQDLYAESAMQADPAWSPDGSAIAYLSRAGDIGGPGWLAVMRLGDLKPRLLQSNIDAFAWAPDGTSITVERQAEVSDTIPHWTLSNVLVADGTEIPIAVPKVSFEFAVQSLEPDTTVAELPTPTGSPAPSLAPEPFVSPAPAQPAVPPPGWAVAFDATVTDGAGSECIAALIRELAPRRTIATHSFCGENFNQGLWAPDGSAYAALADDRLFMVSRAGDVRSVPEMLRPNSMMWSPDARWLAVRVCQPDPDFRPTFTPPVCSWSLVTPDGGSTRAIAGSPSWSADGSHLSVTLPDGRVSIGFGDGSSAATFDTLPSGSSLSPDGSTALYVKDGDAWIMPFSDETPRNLTRFDFGGVYVAEWSPDGGWILAAREGQVWIMRADGSQRRRIAIGGLLSINGWRWAPDGRHLTISTWTQDTGTPSTAIVSTDGAPTVLLDNADNPLWSPDGRYLAVADRSGDGGPNGIDIMNADGSGRTTIWTGTGNNLPQAWIR